MCVASTLKFKMFYRQMSHQPPSKVQKPVDRSGFYLPSILFDRHLLPTWFLIESLVGDRKPTNIVSRTMDFEFESDESISQDSLEHSGRAIYFTPTSIPNEDETIRLVETKPLWSIMSSSACDLIAVQLKIRGLSSRRKEFISMLITGG